MSWYGLAATKRLCTNLTRLEKFLLIMLAYYHNDETGRCDPSVGRLAHDILSSERHVTRALQALHKKGLIGIVRRREDGKQNSNQYDLHYLQTDTTSPCQHDIQTDKQGDKQTDMVSPKPLVRTLREQKREQKVDAPFLEERYERLKNPH